jgi:D-3-phosphoglycerate dehydrogenase / 2-oxoglutarate reductase
MPKLVLVDGGIYPPGSYAEVEKLCAKEGVCFEQLDCKNADDVVAKASDAEAMIDIFLRFDEALMSRLPRLRLIVRHGIGVDVVNVGDCTKCGVMLCNVPDYGVEEVAVHALSMLLALERKIVFYGTQVKSGVWDETLGYEMRRVSERTLGLIGFGRIGRRFALIAKPLGYTVLAYDPYLPREAFAAAGATAVTMDELMARSDAIVLMAPNTPETVGIVNAANLAKAKDGLLVVNTARSQLIDHDALRAALESGKIAGIGMDVLPHEPPSAAEQAFVQHPHVVITPHVAYRSFESFAALRRLCGETALAFFRGEQPPNIVNPDVLKRLRTPQS